MDDVNGKHGGVGTISNEELSRTLCESVKSEFGELANAFEIWRYPHEGLTRLPKPPQSSMGVYAWIGGGQLVKVGKAHQRIYSRAFSHITAKKGTGPKVRESLFQDPRPLLLLFIVRNSKQIHWVLALEAFLEINGEPVVKSDRLG